MAARDTIVALSSGAPPSGVAVIRLSGPSTRAVIEEVVGKLPDPRRLVLSDVKLNGTVVDRGLVAWMPGPASFTGEDCGELQVHGSPAVVRFILRTLVSHFGVRLAEAGEFTRRAFENGRLDLTEVEGLSDLLDAETESQRSQALARMSGHLSDRIDRWRTELVDLRAEIEARLDFSDEGDVSALPPDFADRLTALRQDFSTAIADVGRGRVVREGFRVALAGPPNAGKSSLLNALARSEVAIVTDEPGTTRDVRELQVDLSGRLVILVDMAGLRETGSIAEAEGVRRARTEIADANLVLWLVAPDTPEPLLPETSAKIWRVGTKSDLGSASGTDLRLSVHTGDGIEDLTSALSNAAAEAGGDGSVLVSRERDRIALRSASDALERASGLVNEPELLAEELRTATIALERLLGRVDVESVLDRLFSSFCIGK